MTFKFDKEVRGLLRKKERLHSDFAPDIRRASETGNQDKKQELIAELFHEEALIQFRIDRAVTSELVALANRLLLPIPNQNDGKYWSESSPEVPYRCLTQAGVGLVRDSIREEMKKRRDARIQWLEATGKIVGMLTGFAGTLIGLVALLKK